MISCAPCLQCIIDLKENVLRVGGGEVSVPFLQGLSYYVFAHFSSFGSMIFSANRYDVVYDQKRIYHHIFLMNKGTPRKHLALELQ